jgi:hypothetical protein
MARLVMTATRPGCGKAATSDDGPCPRAQARRSGASASWPVLTHPRQLCDRASTGSQGPARAMSDPFPRGAQRATGRLAPPAPRPGTTGRNAGPGNPARDSAAGFVL